MDIFIMYFLMLCDLLFTFFNYQEAEELNPLFQKLLYGNGQVWFIYLKLALNTLAAYAIIIIRKYKRCLSIGLALLGIIVYGLVFYFHIEIYQVNHGQDPITPGLRQMLYATGEAAGGVMGEVNP
jgi:hypothetical protein